jgi:hypothetical protein
MTMRRDWRGLAGLFMLSALFWAPGCPAVV